MQQDLGKKTLHASAVAIGGAGLLILGQPGSGKSTLAMQLISLGAKLISDDQVVVNPKDDGVLMSAPRELRGRIEARGLGILRCEATEAWLSAVVDLDHTEDERLPKPRETLIAGKRFELFHRVETPSFSSMLLIMLSGGVE